MNFNEQFMKNAIARINELQNEIIEKYKNIEGAEQYVAQQVELYKQDIELRNKFKSIEKEGEKIAKEFFSKNANMIDSAKRIFQADTSKK